MDFNFEKLSKKDLEEMIEYIYYICQSRSDGFSYSCCVRCIEGFILYRLGFSSDD